MRRLLILTILTLCGIGLLSYCDGNWSAAQISGTLSTPGEARVRVANHSGKEFTLRLRRWFDAKGNPTLCDEFYYWIKPKSERLLTRNDTPVSAARVEYSVTTSDGSTHWDAEYESGPSLVVTVTKGMLPKPLVGATADISLKPSGVFETDDYEDVDILDVRKPGNKISSITFDFSGKRTTFGSSAIVKMTIGKTVLVYDDKAKTLVDEVILAHRNLLLAEKHERDRQNAIAKLEQDRRTKAAKERQASVNRTGLRPARNADSEAISRAILKILGASVANEIARDQDNKDGLLSAVVSIGARAGRNKLIESALRDAFPQFEDVEIRAIRRVSALYLDGKLSLTNFGKETAKEEIVEALKGESPQLAASAEVVDFLYELHETRVAQKMK